jgi:hypothetical protein
MNFVWLILITTLTFMYIAYSGIQAGKIIDAERKSLNNEKHDRHIDDKYRCPNQCNHPTRMHVKSNGKGKCQYYYKSPKYKFSPLTYFFVIIVHKMELIIRHTHRPNQPKANSTTIIEHKF